VFSPVWWFGDPGGFTDVIFGWIGIAMIWFAVAGFGPKVIKFFEDSEKEARYNKHKEREERKERIKRKSKQKIEESQAGPRMTGTAFFIDQKGHLITNFHVIDGCGNNLKAMCDNEEIKCRVIAIDKSLDLALLKVNFKSESYVQIDDKILSKMQPIIAAGYPALHLSDDLKLTSGIISSLKGFNNNSALIQIDAALNSGNSGGPIIDKEDGKLAAVAVARMEGSHYQSINYGIKSSRVKEFIESNKIKLPKKKIRTKKIKRKEIADNLENTTVLVFH
tara:strand:+ start:398 stop:1231 length:834 start_codon:yes stop_codon:yes gene_type:complete